MKKGFLIAVAIVVSVTFMGCSNDVPAANTYQTDSKKVEETAQKLQNATPIPDLSNSAERQNIARRATTFDDVNKVSYIYLINYGKVMAWYSIKGKVSSLNSYLSPVDKLVNGKGDRCSNNGSDYPCYLVGAPDIDGAYGENADGIFFFTTEGIYIEYVGDYMMSDEYLKVSTPVELTREVK